MPFVRTDEDGYEVSGDDEVTYTGPFNYYPPAEVAYKPRPFDPADLSPAAAAAYELLRAGGIVRFRVRYDGGHDEGFAHADAGWTADGADRSIDDLVADLSAPDRVNALRMAFDARLASLPPTAYYARLTEGERVRRALDELADELASCLLGNGYGTGECSLYGALTADLTTGTLTDDPDAGRPPDVTFD